MYQASAEPEDHLAILVSLASRLPEKMRYLRAYQSSDIVEATYSSATSTTVLLWRGVMLRDAVC